jgi:hypothetical protein
MTWHVFFHVGFMILMGFFCLIFFGKTPVTGGMLSMVWVMAASGIAMAYGVVLQQRQQIRDLEARVSALSERLPTQET